MRRTNRVSCRVDRGFVILAVLVVLALATTLFGLWAQAAIREHRRLDGEALRLQAVRLAESGIGRGMVRRASDPGYTEETWSIPAAEFSNRSAAEVRIRVEPAGAALRFVATADYPAGAVRRARVTKQVEFPNPVSGDEP